jgi:glycosyltransferase involved in cell wall biosynthesis
MRKPFLSIITINYNNLDGLKKTTSSVFEQTYEDIEFIIIDGGSDDGSLDLIKENGERIDHWVSEDDSGIYHAMNKGIKAATGEYLLFLNSGDVLTEVSALEDFTDHPSFDGDIIYGDYKFERGEKVYPDTLYPAYFMKTSLPHQSTFFKKSVFELMGLYDEKYKIGADRAFYIKCYLSGKFKFQHLKYFLTLFDLSGFSNDLEFMTGKKKEDEQLLRDMYGSKYEHYKQELEEELKRNVVPKYSYKGIMKRIKKRIRMLWMRP